MAPRIRVFVADDHPLYRAAMVEAVSGAPELELVGEAGDGRSALAAIRAALPDVSVIDVRMPELGGLQVLEAIRRDAIETSVLFVSASAEPAEVYAALSAGAAGYLDKSASADDLTTAIRTVAEDGTYLPRQLESAVLGQIAAHRAGQAPGLSPRELEVLRLVADGLSAREAGERLFIEESTVKSHLKSAYEKLGVTGRAAAIAEAMRSGLLD